MKSLGNVIWLVFGGALIALEYVISSIAMMVTIVGIPFGIGLKVKLGNRWNLNTQWCNRLYFSDKIEGVSNFDNPNNLNGNNILNNDLISSLTIGISYNIWRKSCDCIKNKNN